MFCFVYIKVLGDKNVDWRKRQFFGGVLGVWNGLIVDK